MERISSDEQLNSESNWFVDWKEWDPIASGEGDLPPLDDISKLFSAFNKLPKSPPAIDFLSSANKFSLKDHISSAGKDLLKVGGKTTPISCPKKPGSSTATTMSSTSEVPVDDRKPVAVTPLGLQISSYEGDKISPSYMPKTVADSEEPVSITVSNYEILENSIPNNVASDAPGPLSSDVPRKHCTVTGKNSPVFSIGFDMRIISNFDKISPMGMGDLKISDRSDLKTPSTVTELVDISSAADGNLSSNGGGTFFTRSLANIIQEEKINANGVEREHKDDVLSDNALLMMDSVEPAQSEVREALLPDDVLIGDGFSEMKMLEKEGLIDSDACMEDALVKPEDRNRQGSIAADGCASYRLKSGSAF